MEIVKRCYLLCAIFGLVNVLAAQPPVDWMRIYHIDNYDAFGDVYAVSDGGYIMCGGCSEYFVANDSTMDSWMVKVDNDGEVVWMNRLGVENVYDRMTSIIETDLGDFVAGGESNREVAAMMVDEEGDRIWFSTYVPGACQAVIELKSGEFLLAGHSGQRGYLAMIDYEGEILWSETYGQDFFNRIWTMRETEGGVVMGGYAVTEDDEVPYMIWLLKADLENQGELVWERHYALDRYNYCRALVSVPNGGFALTGYVHNGGGGIQNPSRDVILLKVDDDGRLEWSRRYDLERAEVGAAIARLGDGGYVIAGAQLNYNPFAIRTTSNGVVRWQHVYDFSDEGEFGLRNAFSSVIIDRDNSIVAAGRIEVTNDGTLLNGLLIKLEPEVLEPILFYWSPEDTVFSVLLGDSVQFVVRARDQQGDELSYLWISGDDSLRDDTTYTKHFDELGEYFVQCQVSNDEYTSAVTWHISVVEWYISGFTPDSLDFALRRGRSIDFALDVRALEGVDLAYNWTHIGRNHRREDIGDSDSVTVAFDLTGRQQVVGRVRADDDDDEVFWNIDVMSCVWYWWPHATELTASVDTTIEFAVFPFNPDSDSLRYLWTLDGELLDSTRVISVEFPDTGLYSVTVYAWDGAEVDTIDWRVEIVLPVGVKPEPGNLLPGEAVLYPPVPNPFNAMTMVRFALPVPEHVRLSVFDLRGREVAVLADRQFDTGHHRAEWNAAGHASGVYFCRIQAGEFVGVKKMMLMR